LSIHEEAFPETAKKQIDTDEMDWDAYAKHYDQMCRFNPAYQDNIALLLDRLSAWDLPSNPAICDLGAGTGNYIVRLSEAVPTASFTHVDFDRRMIDSAINKYKDHGISHVRFVHEEIHNVEFPDQSFDLIICVNALYAFTPQQEVLAGIRKWLKPAGKLFLIDFGRKQRTMDWAIYMFRESIKSRRVGEYAKAFLEGREVLKQSQRSTKGQESGRYWLHSTEEFGQSLRTAGFTVEELKPCYRGYADMAVCSR
jgi:ubiquinone/menaquinone biosynthesis C-methylase UbiE